MTALVSILTIAGAAAAVVALSAALSPQICRLLAATLLTEAETMEAARKFRSRAWSRNERRLGVKLTRKEAAHGRGDVEQDHGGRYREE